MKFWTRRGLATVSGKAANSKAICCGQLERREVEYFEMKLELYRVSSKTLPPTPPRSFFSCILFNWNTTGKESLQFESSLLYLCLKFAQYIVKISDKGRLITYLYAHFLLPFKVKHQNLTQSKLCNLCKVYTYDSKYFKRKVSFCILRPNLMIYSRKILNILCNLNSCLIENFALIDFI